jgi:Resolvase, N terminal domain
MNRTGLSAPTSSSIDSGNNRSCERSNPEMASCWILPRQTRQRNPRGPTFHTLCLRSTRDLLNTQATITGKGAGFRSLHDTWADTTTPHGRLMLTVLGGLAEFERELIRARTGGPRTRQGARREDGATPEAHRSPEAARLSGDVTAARKRLPRSAAVTTCPTGRFRGWRDGLCHTNSWSVQRNFIRHTVTFPPVRRLHGRATSCCVIRSSWR